MGILDPFQLHELKINLTVSELEALSITIRNNIPNDRFIENLIMKLYDVVEEKLREIKS